MPDAMKELVTFLSKSLVDEPEQVDVQVLEEDRAYVIELTVAPDDLGKVIGKEGRTARAMRTLLSAMATRDRKRAVLDILE